MLHGRKVLSVQMEHTESLGRAGLFEDDTHDTTTVAHLALTSVSPSLGVTQAWHDYVAPFAFFLESRDV